MKSTIKSSFLSGLVPVIVLTLLVISMASCSSTKNTASHSRFDSNYNALVRKPNCPMAIH